MNNNWSLYTMNSLRSMLRSFFVRTSTWWKIKYGRFIGRDEQSIVEDAMGSREDIEDLAKQVVIVTTLDKMGRIFNLSFDSGRTNQALTGWAAILQHCPDLPVAHRWSAMFDTSSTFGDIWKFFLSENKLNERLVTFKKDYDHDFFTWLLTLRLSPNYGFGINLAEASQSASQPGQLRLEYQQYQMATDD